MKTVHLVEFSITCFPPNLAQVVARPSTIESASTHHRKHRTAPSQLFSSWSFCRDHQSMRSVVNPCSVLIIVRTTVYKKQTNKQTKSNLFCKGRKLKFSRPLYMPE